MKLGPAWIARFQARWKKFQRDPVSFYEDLPSRRLGEWCLSMLAASTPLFDKVDGDLGRIAAEWARDGVRLRRRWADAGPTPLYRFEDDRGREPAVWPGRVVIAPSAAAGVLCLFGEDEAPDSAVALSDDRPAFLTLAGPATMVRGYSLDKDQLPREIAIRPTGPSGVFVAARARGVERNAALRLAWPAARRSRSTIDTPDYRRWIARTEGRAAPPEDPAAKSLLVSVLMPVHDPDPRHLKEALASVIGQSHQAWDLCIADDGSHSAEVRAMLDETAGREPRVRLTRLDPSRGVEAATNAAMALASGEACTFLDHDDRLAPGALAAMARAFADPAVQAVYTDEDTLDHAGRRTEPVFKPDFDPERALAQNYVNHAFAARTALLRKLGGLREGFEGAQDHDLLLRISRQVPRAAIRHIPEVLYHWRSYPGGGSLSQRKGRAAARSRRAAVIDHLAALDAPAGVEPGWNGFNRIRWRPRHPTPVVRVIVPTRDRPELLRACAAGVLSLTDYPSLELCIVDNGSTDKATLALLEDLGRRPRTQVMRIEAPFNFADLNNRAAAADGADLLAFVNDDVLVVEPDWLNEMAALACREDVGAVGAKLFYGDGRVQHAGIVLGVGELGVAGHEFRGAPGDAAGPQGRLFVTRETSAVTAACMVVERSKFLAVGGFDAENFPVAFNDVDLCLRLAGRGWRTLWTPHARLIHLESASRGADRGGKAARRLADEAKRMHERWGGALASDPCYNPALTRQTEDFALAENQAR